MQSPICLLPDTRRRSFVTAPGYRQGTKPANAGKTYPAEVLTHVEIHRLMAALGRGNAGARNRAAVVLMWRCGLRIAEALALYPKDVDLDAGTVTVLCGKGGKRRTVGIDPQAGAVVQTWLDRRARLGLTGRQPLLCVISQPTLGKAMYPSVLREAIKDAGQRAGIDRRVHPHGLRHTFASDCVRDGIPMPFIQLMLGHADLRTTSHYLASLTPWDAIHAMRARSWDPPALDSPPVLAQQFGVAA